MVEANQLLRAARQATPSLTSPDFALSRSELAELVNAAIYRRTGRPGTLDGHYVAQLERGVSRGPGAECRRAFREVLGAATDAELGFRYEGPSVRSRRGANGLPPLPSGPGSETEQERLAWVVSGLCRVDGAVVGYLREVQAAQRYLEDVIGSVRMLPVALAQIELVEQLIRQADGGMRTALVAALAEYHLFAGRMADYNGDRRAALFHDDQALEAAREVDDADLVAGVFGLKSHLAWGVGDAADTVAFAEAGRQDAARLGARVEGFLAQMQARGHGLGRENPVAERLLDTTEQRTAQAYAQPDDEPWWTYPQTPERVLFQRGMTYRELGRHHEARDLFDQARAALSASYRRDQGRWAASLALAAAHDGDLTGALTAGRQAIAIVRDTGSVYTIADLHSLRRVLDHHQKADRATLDDFDEALRDITAPTRR
ncbi:MAG: hypothetical protein ACRDRL_31075 [Sciscionella sp.]